MGDETGEVTVDVAVTPEEESAPETVVDAAPVVIVEDSGSDAGTVTEAEADRRVEEAREQTAMELAVAGLIQTVEEHGYRLDALDARQDVTAEVVADVAVTTEELGEAVAEEAQDSLGEDLDGDGKPDEAPTTARRHWLFRTRDEWRNK